MSPEYKFKNTNTPSCLFYLRQSKYSSFDNLPNSVGIVSFKLLKPGMQMRIHGKEVNIQARDKCLLYLSHPIALQLTEIDLHKIFHCSDIGWDRSLDVIGTCYETIKWEKNKEMKQNRETKRRYFHACGIIYLKKISRDFLALPT